MIYGNDMLDVISFGEILWDVIEGVPHIGGAPFNFAAHVAKCGLKSALVSSVGDDSLGRRAMSEVARFGVDDRFVSFHPTLPTGTVNVYLKDGSPAYDIVKPVAWDEITIERVANQPVPRAFYFGSLVRRSPVSSKTLDLLLRMFTGSIVFYDVNLRQDFWHKEKIEKDIGCSDVLKVNDEEMSRLGFIPKRLFESNPRLKVVIETCGKDGCLVWSREGCKLTSPAIPDGPIVDTVGAGDSFSAAFLSAILSGKTLAEAAIDGNVRAGKVASRAGAIPEDL